MVRSSAENAIDLDLLFRQYSRELNNYAYRRLGDRDAASDVVQDCFLRFLVWKRKQAQLQDRLPNGARFFLWRIVGNLTIDRIRHQGLLGKVLRLDDLADSLTDGAPTPERHLETRQQYLALKAALDEVPEKHRSALLLNRLDGLTHQEIAARLGVSPSMVSKYVMSVLTHCLKRLPDTLL